MSEVVAKEKKLTPIEVYWNSMSPEERTRRRAEMGQKLKETTELRRIKKAEIKRQAEALMPRVMANTLIEADDPNWTPDQGTTERISQLLKDGGDPGEIKTLLGISDKAWAKIIKVVYHSQQPNTESVASELYAAKKQAKLAADKMVKIIEKEIKNHNKNEKIRIKLLTNPQLRKQKPTIPSYLLTQLSKAVQDKLNAENEYARVVSQIKVFDKQGGAPMITIKTTVPRPGEAPVIEKITATKKVTIEEAIKEFGSGSRD